MDWDRWLDPSLIDIEGVADLLDVGHAQAGRFAAHPVSRAVGSNQAQGPQLLDPVPESDLRGVVDPATGEIVGEV